MKGWKLVKPNDIQEQEINEVVNDDSISKVKITKALITLADVLRYNGESECNDVVLGSSGIGVVSETETNLFGLEKGKHGYIEPRRACLECYNCKNGNTSKCSNIQVAGEEFHGFFHEGSLLLLQYYP